VSKSILHSFGFFVFDFFPFFFFLSLGSLAGFYVRAKFGFFCLVWIFARAAREKRRKRERAAQGDEKDNSNYKSPRKERRGAREKQEKLLEDDTQWSNGATWRVEKAERSSGVGQGVLDRGTVALVQPKATSVKRLARVDSPLAGSSFPLLTQKGRKGKGKGKGRKKGQGSLGRCNETEAPIKEP
jgi:hypothetical protein